MPEPPDSRPSDPGAARTPSSRPGSDSNSPAHAVELPYAEELQAMLAGRYVVEGFIGQGGMGAVYRGLQMPLKRPVAIKILAKGVGEDYAFEERFKREAYAMASLTHPNIVQVYDCGDAGEHFLFISMEFVEGGDLSDALKNNQVTPDVALKLMPQICEGLQAAHERGIVHRDIKPANIFLTAGGRAKVADFGLAKRFDSGGTMVTKTGLGLGTPDYAAPEQFENLPDIDHRADIYSLGVMFYQLLTGKLPRGAWKAPSARAPIDPRLDGVVRKAMETERADRYQSVAAMKSDILRLLPQPMHTGPVPVARPITPAGGLPPVTTTGSVKPAPSSPGSPRVTGAVKQVPSQPMPPGSGNTAGVKSAGTPARSGPVSPRSTGAVKPTPAPAAPVARHAASTAPVPPATKKRSVNFYAAIFCAIAVLVFGVWVLLKPGGGGKAVELLDIENPNGTALHGTWTKMADGLNGRTDNATPNLQNDDRKPLFELRYSPPAEYDMEVEFTRNSGTVSLIFCAGPSTCSHQFTQGSDDGRPARAGLTQLDRESIARPSGEATVMIPPPTKGVRHVAVVQVRRDYIRSTLDGAEVIRWSGDYARLNSAPSLALSRDSRLGIGSSDGDVTFHRVTVREISGPGQIYSTERIAGGGAGDDGTKIIAAWAIGVKGFIVVQKGGITEKITSLENLPMESDGIIEVEVPGGRAPEAIPAEVIKKLAGLSGVKRLALRQCKLTSADLSTILADKPQLTNLGLDNNNLDDGAALALQRLQQLEYLGLAVNKAFTGHGLAKPGAAFPKLNFLSLNDTAASDASMGSIANLTNLRSLYLNRTKVTDAGIAKLQPLAQLEDLRFRNLPVTVHGLQALRGAMRMRHFELDLGRGVNSWSEFATLAGTFPNLLDFNIFFQGSGGKPDVAQLGAFEDLAAFTQLKKIELYNANNVGTVKITGLDRLVKLEHFATDLPFQDGDVTPLKALKSLRTLRAINGKITETGALALTSFGALQEISKRAFTEAGLKAFQQYRPDVKILD